MNTEVEENYFFQNVKKEEETFQTKEEYVEVHNDPLTMENNRLQTDIQQKEEYVEVNNDPLTMENNRLQTDIQQKEEYVEVNNDPLTMENNRLQTDIQQKEEFVEVNNDPLTMENNRLQTDNSVHSIKQEICEVEENKEDINFQDENSGNNINMCYVKEEMVEVEVKGESAEIYNESECAQTELIKYEGEIIQRDIKDNNNEDTCNESECSQIEETNVQNNYIQLTTVRTFDICGDDGSLGENASITDLSHHNSAILFGALQANLKEVVKQTDMLEQRYSTCFWNSGDDEQEVPTISIKEEVMDLRCLASYSELDPRNDEDKETLGLKTWTQEDMDSALDALRSRSMTLAKASAIYKIPSTTLWQRAHRMGIDTPKNGSSGKTWTNEALNNCLEALHSGSMSANKASKTYGIPSSTLYKIAKREGIKLAPPFNAAPTTWSRKAMNLALEAIRSGQISVQKASIEFGIPPGTLYGRCKREGIELSRNAVTPWTEDVMGEALEAVKVGQMTINQASVHYKLPYSSLYGRIKRGKSETDGQNSNQETHFSPPLFNSW